MPYILEGCLLSSVSGLSLFWGWLERETYGFNPDGGVADGRLEIVERHAVLADS